MSSKHRLPIVLILVILSLALFLSCAQESSDESSTENQPKVKEQTTDAESESAMKSASEIAPEASEDKSEPAMDVQKTKLAGKAKDPKPAKASLIPLAVKLPKPMFIGTPQNIRVPNLEKPLGKARPAFLAPAGTKNVAAGKSIMSTDDMPIIGEVEMMTDGDKEAADGSYVELGPFLQHVTIDLEAKHDIYAVLFWHFHKQPRVYFDVIVQVADDSDFKRNVKTIFNNDLDNSAGLGQGTDMHYVETSEGRLLDAKGVQGRYVRLYSSGNSNNDLNHYIEIEVYGKPAK